MLASLLPGVRHLRTPLAVGYIWLLALWVVARHWLDDPNPAALGSFADDLSQLAENVGRPIAGAAVAFVAYVVGALSTSLTTAFLRPASVSPKGSVELRNSARQFVGTISDDKIDEILTRADNEIHDELRVLKGRG